MIREFIDSLNFDKIDDVKRWLQYSMELKAKAYLAYTGSNTDRIRLKNLDYQEKRIFQMLNNLLGHDS